jgi:hypothetical protein
LVELVASTAEAYRGLLGHLASLADQVQEVHFAAPGDNAWLALLQTAQNLRPGAEIGLMTDTGNIANGAMLRLTDVKLALETLPAAPLARGEVLLDVTDAVLPQNARAYRVSAREGRLKVRPEVGRSGARPRLPRLRVSAEFLGPLVAGTISPGRASELGLIESSRGGAETIETWFRARAPFLYQLNAF